MADLTTQEQTNVRAALRYLRVRCGGNAPLAAALRLNAGTVHNVSCKTVVTPTIAFRVARFAGVGVDDLLAGKYPPAGACPHCGHVAADAVNGETVADAH